MVGRVIDGKVEKGEPLNKTGEDLDPGEILGIDIEVSPNEDGRRGAGLPGVDDDRLQGGHGTGELGVIAGGGKVDSNVGGGCVPRDGQVDGED